MDPDRVIALLTARIAQVLGGPAAEAMRDAALLEAQLHAAQQAQQADGQEDDDA